MGGASLQTRRTRLRWPLAAFSPRLVWMLSLPGTAPKGRSARSARNFVTGLAGAPALGRGKAPLVPKGWEVGPCRPISLAGQHADMTMSSVYPRPDSTARLPETVPARATASPGIDWRAARQAERACCCAAKPAVMAVMPANDRRPGPTELLLCGHHYRASKSALAAAGATVLYMNGSRVADSADWALTQA